jgi:hypothetical protein
MKIRAMILAVVAVTVPLVANAAGEKGVSGKNVCLLYSENCPEQADTILEKIAKLEHEISRGESVYFQAEIARLERKLEEYQGLLNSLLSGGGGD